MRCDLDQIGICFENLEIRGDGRSWRGLGTIVATLGLLGVSERRYRNQRQQNETQKDFRVTSHWGLAFD